MHDTLFIVKRPRLLVRLRMASTLFFTFLFHGTVWTASPVIKGQCLMVGTAGSWWTGPGISAEDVGQGEWTIYHSENKNGDY